MNNANETPLVTIAIPTFNREKYLQRALDSALNQTYKNIEVLIGDNASPDGTGALCTDRAVKDNRIKYYRHEANRGPMENFRFLLEKAKGDYFMWHADDDTYAPDFVQKCLKFLQLHPDTVLCFSDYVQVDETDSIQSEWRLHHLYPESQWLNGQIDFFSYPFCRSTVTIYGLYRTKVLRCVGGPKPLSFRRLISGSEAPFLAKLAKIGRIVVLPEILFRYNNHKIGRDSVAHHTSQNLCWLDKVLIYTTIEIKLLGAALTAQVSWTQRLRLTRACLSAILRKVISTTFVKRPR